jgi:hypothetical protein
LLALSGQIPEVPLSSFLEEMPETPQINIGIEDNAGEFDNGPEMSPSVGIKFLDEIAKNHFSDKSLIIEILKIRMKLSFMKTQILP